MQNLVVLMDPSKYAFDNSLKAGNMIFNRFCIDEEAAFELSGVNYRQKSPRYLDRLRAEEKWGKEAKIGKEYSFLRSYFILRNFIFMND